MILEAGLIVFFIVDETDAMAAEKKQFAKI